MKAARQQDKIRLFGLCVLIMGVCGSAAGDYPPDNAAVLYYKTCLEYQKPEGEIKEALKDVAVGKAAPTQAMRDYIKGRAPNIKTLADAAQIKACDWGYDYSQGFNMVMAPLARGQQGELQPVLRRIQREGFVRARVNGQLSDIKELAEVTLDAPTDVDVVVDRLVLRPEVRGRLADAVELSFALASSSVPNAVTADHHAALRACFTDEEVRTLLGVVSVAGFMNRYNDSLATVTDAESTGWAALHLADVGWSIGKHTGADHEQRRGPPGA